MHSSIRCSRIHRLDQAWPNLAVVVSRVSPGRVVLLEMRCCSGHEICATVGRDDADDEEQTEEQVAMDINKQIAVTFGRQTLERGTAKIRNRDSLWLQL